ncbi:4-hydroxythreonine-4-phosphate dehydrogenase PdxA [Ideonella dechloratans]|uniref:4-hydroxythreonine-4-phosphate dehydrogenase PdxA n=1 Tax=Ideonella dechloratans TaxID=36863 RepID=A0A643FGQ2_IDEDE|nr:4-hydroxythreonine-4-phosphate dehydrogenase PdxA [Ideonella dechloratans]KAB0585158.1 4-hydroxythreonine-4-phosphate dehydrogenase PdxA [Ideonella dechloratans]UFU11022.1 4-hydroxythreonine-4-phosphate dehydrogenase PdxA [Ideonella dechloratans]
MTSTTPRLLVTMGDPVGIGPEIIAKAFAAGALDDALVVGDVGALRRGVRAAGLSLPVAWLDTVADWVRCPPACLPVWQPPGLPPALDQLPWGQVDARAGAAAAACIVGAVSLLQAGQAQGLVTAPLHKEALGAAGVDFPGHTEMLQSLCAVDGLLPPVRMMLANEELRVVLVTIHVALRRAIDALDMPGILETLRITHAAGQRFGMPAPRIAVAGLNPHAGEGGLFGDEEIRLIAPAIAAARAEGIDARGPYAPDTVFMRARHAPGHPGEFDFVVAMTHDHGLIPVKYLGVEEGVNVTLGLPLVRTSPDHGTAFDVAGQGRASAASLVAAARMARRLLGAS